MISLSRVGKRIWLSRYVCCVDGFRIEWQQNVSRSGELGTGGFYAKINYIKKGYGNMMKNRILSNRKNYLESTTGDEN